MMRNSVASKELTDEASRTICSSLVAAHSENKNIHFTGHVAPASNEKRQSCDEFVTPMTGVGWTASVQPLVQIAVDKRTHCGTLVICCCLGERARAGDRPPSLRRDQPSPVRDWTVGRPDKLLELQM